MLRLDANKRHIFAARHALAIYSRKAICTYIPKNACSSLRYSIALMNGLIEGPEDIDWNQSNNKTFCASLAEILTAEYTFVVVRCPFARLASAFLDKAINEKRRVQKLRAHPPLRKRDYQARLQRIANRTFKRRNYSIDIRISRFAISWLTQSARCSGDGSPLGSAGKFSYI